MSVVRSSTYLVAALALLVAGGAWAEGPSGREIMDKVLNRASWKDMQGTARLRIVSAKGEARPERVIKVWSRKDDEGLTSMIMLFQEPADYRGSGFLMIERGDRDDDRWLYSKGMRRLTRIQGSGKGGSFMSSDFTFYDIGKPKLSEWRFTRLPDEPCGKTTCYAVRADPATPEVAKETGYHRIVWLVDRDELVTVGARYYDDRVEADPKAKPFKEMKVLEHVDLGGVPFATHMVMTDTHTGQRSEMKFEGLQIDEGLDPGFFSKRTLLRGR